MTAAADALEPSVRTWLKEQLGGEITLLERAPARRQAWLVDSTGPGGAADACFLRVAVPGDPANDPDALWREYRVVEALAGVAFPVPRVRAADRALGAVLFERVPGEWQLHEQAPPRQHAVYDHYVALLAALHRLDAGALRVGDVLATPTSARACALDAVETAMRDRWYADRDDPLAVFALTWLRRNVPDQLGSTTLVHGDAGVGNFLFSGDRVTAVLDWEWAHIGNPMEDLAALNIHASFFPSGSMPAMLQRYEAAGGATVDLDQIRFYRVENMLRSVAVLRAITGRLNVHDPVGLNVAYRILCERFLCDCLAEAIGVDLAPSELPPITSDEPSLHEFVADSLRQFLVPELEAGWPREQALSAVRLVEYLARCDRLGSACEAIEQDEVSALLGERPGDVASGRARLGTVVPTWDGTRDEATVRYLAARARREELLAAPLMSVLPEVRLRPLC